ncbi:hypothetical protein [Streptomyces sp. NBC_00829]|uniref:hypothetical protein n=1 Tax=Streptomyces sp. NBC_00829 TaxID=2903679 RepID=UPI00386BA68D|nr:hypothetical protein OG293_38255 [Streptomyces sp. NBC_00829]
MTEAAQGCHDDLVAGPQSGLLPRRGGQQSTCVADPFRQIGPGLIVEGGVAQRDPQVHQVAQGAGQFVVGLPSAAGFGIPVGQFTGSVRARWSEVGGQVEVLDGEVEQGIVGEVEGEGGRVANLQCCVRSFDSKAGVHVCGTGRDGAGQLAVVGQRCMGRSVRRMCARTGLRAQRARTVSGTRR